MLKEIDISLLDPRLTLFELNLRVDELAKKDWVSDQSHYASGDVLASQIKQIDAECAHRVSFFSELGLAIGEGICLSLPTPYLSHPPP